MNARWGTASAVPDLINNPAHIGTYGRVSVVENPQRMVKCFGAE
jgi:hypothetical protein